jgi:hypothetical protein
MIDFEREIEIRLDQFQHLTGKGNVKDSNRTLYEIVRLMLGMINHRNEAVSEVVEIASEKPQAVLEPIIVNSPTKTVETAVDLSETVDEVTITEALALPIKPARHAPYGYTAAGNVRRLRNRKKVT